ncbi:two-component system response regulator [Malaciobacter halophilus]|uniref:Two-component system response regulator n=1 Tax=Malaciobacter halophilus TaxID=197482 RepID=A0A2N1J0L1_9BACT|nr:response regulator [Malaciobacter halophilus]AXH08907.1 signal transduction response regulator [Malaciobacter halophilus]PKI80076.1 two-component system response regulator [Malaciobacter halophilus]
MQEKIIELRKLKLLFVEDEDDLINIITDTLNKLEANFLTAQNGQEALEIIEANDDLDAVITDINMPILNGLEMIQILKEKKPDLPIIVMSAHTEIEYIDKAKEFGVKDYLLKPFDFMKFIELITSMELKKDVT